VTAVDAIAARLRQEVTGVGESPLVQIATVAEGMPGSIKLCYGESDQPTPDFICRAAGEAALAGHTFYTHTAGTPELRDAIAAKVNSLHGVSYQPSEVMSTVGASAGIFTAIRACIGPGDNAVVVSPAYAIFVNAVTMAGGEARSVPLARDGVRLRLDLDRVRRAMDRNTRLIVVNSPSNPTGWMISPDEQHSLADLAEQYDARILADEVYERLVFDAPIAPSFARVIADKDRLWTPSALKFIGSSQATIAALIAGHSVSRIEYQAVSRFRPLTIIWLCQMPSKRKPSRLAAFRLAVFKALQRHCIRR